MKKLTEKQKLFCQLVLEYHYNLTRAYMDAYKVKRQSAASSASRLSRLLAVREQIKKLLHSDDFLNMRHELIFLIKQKENWKVKVRAYRIWVRFYRGPNISIK